MTNPWAGRWSTAVNNWNAFEYSSCPVRMPHVFHIGQRLGADSLRGLALEVCARRERVRASPTSGPRPRACRQSTLSFLGLPLVLHFGVGQCAFSHCPMGGYEGRPPPQNFRTLFPTLRHISRISSFWGSCKSPCPCLTSLRICHTRLTRRTAPERHISAAISASESLPPSQPPSVPCLSKA